MLFGNGGSATLLEYDENAEPTYGLLRSIGRDFKMLVSPFSGQRHAFWPMVQKFGYEKACAYRDLFHMEGMDVMRFSLKEVVTMIMILKSVLSVIMMRLKYWPVIRLINLLSATWPEKLNSRFLKYHYL